MTSTIYTKPGCFECQKANAWLKNHGIPNQERNIFTISIEQIHALAELTEGGPKDLIDPAMMSNPIYIDKVQDKNLTKNEWLAVLADHPELMTTPILSNQEKIIIGYDSAAMKSSFRYVKVREL